MLRDLGPLPSIHILQYMYLINRYTLWCPLSPVQSCQRGMCCKVRAYFLMGTLYNTTASPAQLHDLGQILNIKTQTVPFCSYMSKNDISCKTVILLLLKNGWIFLKNLLSTVEVWIISIISSTQKWIQWTCCRGVAKGKSVHNAYINGVGTGWCLHYTTCIAKYLTWENFNEHFHKNMTC